MWKDQRGQCRQAPLGLGLWCEPGCLWEAEHSAQSGWASSEVKPGGCVLSTPVARRNGSVLGWARSLSALSSPGLTQLAYQVDGAVVTAVRRVQVHQELGI